MFILKTANDFLVLGETKVADPPAITPYYSLDTKSGSAG